MIILDLNQVMIANLMMSIKGFGGEVNEDIVRHMVLNTIRMNKNKFQGEFGELVIACDDRNYWRKEIFPYYKASRKVSRDKSSLDWNRIFQVMNQVRDELKEFFPYPTIQVESAEADDIIATLVKRDGRLLGGDPILILSGDKDFIQLHKYSNVSQWDPTRKRWIRHNDPESYLLEHIIRGDAGDGVPNVLTEDDCFVAGGRQRPIRSAFVQQIRDSGYEQVLNEEGLRNYFRNRSLIDLEQIPEDTTNRILEELENQSGKGRSKLFNYFIKNRLKNLTEHIQEF